MKGLVGRKIGMTQVFDEGIVVPVTVIEVGPCYVTQKKTKDVDGYTAIQVGFGDIKPKRLSKGELQHLKLHSVPAVRHLREFLSRKKSWTATRSDRSSARISLRRVSWSM